MKKIALASIIDDDQFFQFSTKNLLQATGRIENILQFADGEEALEYFVAHKDNAAKIPDLVFLDLNMPYLDGWQFLDELTTIKVDKKLITIYICTSSSSKLDQDKFSTYPKLNGYFIKPILKQEVFQLLDDQLRFGNINKLD